MITATPYFLSRLATSPLRPAFSSYLSISYQAVNFLMLIYTTATAATASKTYRIRVSSTVLALLFFVLTLSTVSGSSGKSYFVFIMIIDALLALGASVLNTTVVALAALFGPGAMQACFAGQAAVGVVVSALQFLGAFFSSVVDSKPEGETGAQVGPAAAFFALSTVFVLLSLIAHSLLLRTPEYTDVVSQWEAGNVLLVEEPDRPDYSDEEEAGQEEHRSILSPVDDFGVEVPQVKNRVSIWEVAKINKSYNLAVGFCFAVTLVSNLLERLSTYHLIIALSVCFPPNHSLCHTNESISYRYAYSSLIYRTPLPRLQRWGLFWAIHLRISCRAHVGSSPTWNLLTCTTAPHPASTDVQRPRTWRGAHRHWW